MPNPTVTSATYDASTGQLVVSGTNLTTSAGDFDPTQLTLTGQYGSTYKYQLTTTSSGVSGNSSTGFTVQLSTADQLAVDGLFNKAGTTAADGGTAYNLAATASFDTGGAATTTAAVTVSNPVTPTLTSVAYDYSTGTFTLTGTNFVNQGSGGGLQLSDFTLTGQSTAKLSGTASVTSSTSATFTLASAAKTGFNNILDANGSAAINGTTYNLAAAVGWDSGIGAAITTKAIAVTGVPVPTITSATYDASSSQLVVTGTNFAGTASNFNTADLTLVGLGGASTTLTSGDAISSVGTSQFTVTLSEADLLAVDGLLNKAGTAASDGTTYSLSGAVGFDAGATAGSSGGVTVSNPEAPTISAVTYDVSTGALTITGTDLVNQGSSGGINLSDFTLKGENNATYVLTSPAASVTGAAGSGPATSVTATLDNADQTALASLFDANGTASTLGTTYNLAAAAGWDSGIGTAVTTEAVTVSGGPTITQISYNGQTGIFTVTGSDLPTSASAYNPSTFTLLGQGGVSYALTTDNSGISNASASGFTLTLNAADALAVDGLLNEAGFSSSGGTTYNLDQGAGWYTGASAVPTQAISVTTADAPTITGVAFDESTGILSVTGTGLADDGASPGIALTDFTLTGQNGSTYALTGAAVAAASATGFTATLSGADLSAVDALFDKNGTSSSGGTAYNLAASLGWDAGIGAASATHAITVGGGLPQITSATYDPSTGALVVSGTGLGSDAIDPHLLTITGSGGGSYTPAFGSALVSASNGSFTVTIPATALASVSGTFQLSGATNWDTTTNVAAFSGKSVIVGSSGTPTFTHSNTTAPTITTATAITTEVDNGTFVVTGAPDVTGVFAGGMLVAQVLVNDDTSHDTLSIATLGGITASGSTISYNSTAIGTIHSGSTGTPGQALRIDLNANATDAAIAALASAVSISETGLTSSTAARTIGYTLTDSYGKSVGPLRSIVNVTPATLTISGTSAGHQTTDHASATPFVGDVISDTIVSDSVTASVTFATANGALSNLGGGSVAASGANSVWSFTGSVAAAQAALRALVFTPTAQQVAPGGTVTTPFTIAVTHASGLVSATPDTTTSVIATAINDRPVLNNAVSVALGGEAQADITSPNVVAPTDATLVSSLVGFTSNVTDPDVGAVTGLAITGHNTTYGNWWYQVGGSGAWTAIGAVTAATALVLKPTDKLFFQSNGSHAGAIANVLTFVAWDQSDGHTSGQTIDTTSGSATASFSSASAAASLSLAAAAPVIGGAVASQPVTDITTLTPFSSVTLTDVNTNGSVTTSVAFTTANGSLSNLGSGTVTPSGANSVWTITGTPAADQSALRALVFTPTIHQVQPGSSVTTSFTINATGDTTATPNATTSVVATATDTAPTIGGTAAGQPLTDVTSLDPFATLTVTDPDVGATDSATITLTAGGSATDANGSLSGTGLSRTGTGTYSLASATPAALQTALRGLVFTPAANEVTPGTGATTGFTLAIGDGTATTTNSATSAVALSVNDPPTIAGTVADQVTTSQSPIDPFSSVALGDIDVGQTETATVTVGTPANGTLSDPNGGTIGGSGSTYSVSGTLAAVQSALQALVFTPAAIEGAPGSEVTTGFTLSLSDGFASATDSTTSVEASSVEVAPKVAISNAGGTVSSASQILSGTVKTPGYGTVPVVGTVVSLYGSSGLIGTATVNADGTWSTSVTLSPGTNSIEASDTDVAGNSGSSSPVLYTYSLPTAQSVAGKAVDGYIVGATVFADTNGNGSLDPGESSTTTDSSGGFSLAASPASLILVGGVDSATGLPFTGTFEAPANSKTISALTTLVSAVALINGGGIAAAEAQVLTAFSIPSTVDLMSLDPEAGTIAGNAAATATLAAGALVLNTAALLSAAGATTPLKAFATEIATGPGALDLTSSTNVAALAASAGLSGSAASAATALASASNAQLLTSLATAPDGTTAFKIITAASIAAQGNAAQSLEAAVASASDAALTKTVAAYTGSNLSAIVAADQGMVATPGSGTASGTVDTTPPVVAFGASPTFNSDGTVTLTGTVSDNASNVGLPTVEIYEGTTDLGAASVSADGSWSLQVALAADYSGTLSAKATDTLGNSATATSDFSVDTLTPQLSINSTVAFAGHGAFSLSGTVADSAGIASVEIYATIDGQQQAIGSATIASDGSWSLTDQVGAAGQTDITAVAIDDSGNQTSLPADFDLTAGVKGQAYCAYQDSYDASSGDLTGQTFFKANGQILYNNSVVYAASAAGSGTSASVASESDTYSGGTYFKGKTFDSFTDRYDAAGTLLSETLDNRDGSHVTTAYAPGQSLASIGDDTLDANGNKKTTFVFTPGFGQDEVVNFQAGGARHDNLQLSASDFTSIAQILHDTQNQQGSAVITDAVSGDTITLQNVTKAELKAHPGDLHLV